MNNEPRNHVICTTGFLRSLILIFNKFKIRGPQDRRHNVISQSQCYFAARAWAVGEFNSSDTSPSKYWIRLRAILILNVYLSSKMFVAWTATAGGCFFGQMNGRLPNTSQRSFNNASWGTKSPVRSCLRDGMISQSYDTAFLLLTFKMVSSVNNAFCSNQSRDFPARSVFLHPRKPIKTWF